MKHELVGLVIDTGGAFVMMALAVWVEALELERRATGPIHRQRPTSGMAP